MNTLTTVVVRPSRGFRGLQLAELWEYRELLFFLAWRDVKVRYKQTMLGAATRRGAPVGVCGTCMDARGVTDAELSEGTHRSSLDELTSWTVEADKVITF